MSIPETEHLHLLKPTTSDSALVGQINSNMDILDAKYVLMMPKDIASISRSGTTFTVTRQDGTTFTFNQQDTTYSEATTSAAGLMSASDKTKLNGIQAGAQVNPGNATTSAAGLMSAADKTKLNGIASGATANVVSNSLSDSSTTNALSAAKGKELNEKKSGLAQTDWGTSLSVPNGFALVMIDQHIQLQVWCSSTQGIDMTSQAYDPDMNKLVFRKYRSNTNELGFSPYYDQGQQPSNTYVINRSGQTFTITSTNNHSFKAFY